MNYFSCTGFASVVMPEKKNINPVFNDFFEIITVLQLSSQFKIKRMVMQINNFFKVDKGWIIKDLFKTIKLFFTQFALG